MPADGDTGRTAAADRMAAEQLSMMMSAGYGAAWGTSVEVSGSERTPEVT